MSYIGSPPAPNIAGVEVTPAGVSNQANTSTGYFDLPAGTTAERPGTPTTGMMRYNTTVSQYEVYDGSDWKFFAQNSYSYSVEFLVVAGGGGGAGDIAGGGGAGGAIDSTLTVAKSSSLVTEPSDEIIVTYAY